MPGLGTCRTVASSRALDVTRSGFLPCVPVAHRASEILVLLQGLPTLPAEPGLSELPVSLATVPAADVPESIASGMARPSPLPLFLPGEKVMTSEAALFLLMAAAGSPGIVFVRAGGVPGVDWLMIHMSRVVLGGEIG